MLPSLRLLLLCLLSVANADEAGNFNMIEDEGVHVLNKANFEHFVMPKDLVLIEFYAPWCGHCQKLAPEYSKAAKTLQPHGIPLAKVDTSKESELATEYQVQGLPTLSLFRHGVKIEDYDGGRTAGEIVEYMLRQNDPDWKPPPSAVAVLTADNFTTFVGQQRLTLVEFYAPWCKHCKALEPEYEGAASELKEWGITLAKVDGMREKELAGQFGVSGWPSFKLFRKGRSYAYDGPREKQAIIDYLKEQAKPPSDEKTHLPGLTNSLDRLEATVVGFFKGKAASSKLYEEFIVAANEMRGTFDFMHTFDAAIAKSMGIKQESVVVFMPEIFWSEHEEKNHTLTKASATHDEIVRFIKRHSLPLVGHRTKANAFKYADSKALIVVYYDVNYDHQFVKDTQYVRRKVLDVAKDFAGSELRFAVSNEDEYADEMRALGLEDSGEDINVGCFTERQKFRMKPVDDFEAKDLKKFIESLRTGKAKPFTKSMSVPKEQEGAVRKVVADSYDEEIHTVAKDAVVFLHAPWCGHCKEFSPVFKKLAAKFADGKSKAEVVFGKYDGTANDIPYLFPNVKGYPAIFFVKVTDKFNPVQYQGDRSYKSMKDWIREHLTDEKERKNVGKIESFTAENFEEYLRKKSPEEVEKEEATKKKTTKKADPKKDEL